MAGQHIFISYRSTERDFALKLAQDLRAAGIPVWLDRLSGIQPGDDWVQALQDALNNSMALIANVSPEYVRSVVCRNELKRCISLNRPVFPVLLRDVPPEDWPFEIQAGQYVDFREMADYNTSLNELITALRHKLNLPENPALPPAPVSDPLPAQQIDDTVAEAQATAAAKSHGSVLLRLKVEGLQGELNLAVRQYEAVLGNLLLENNPMNRVVLDNQRTHLEQKITRIESELSQLQ